MNELTNVTDKLVFKPAEKNTVNRIKKQIRQFSGV